MNAKAWVENFTEDGVIYDPVENHLVMCTQTIRNFLGYYQ